jgi:hypothetical protein
LDEGSRRIIALPKNIILHTTTVSIPVGDKKTGHIIDCNTVIHRPEQATPIRSSVDLVLPHVTVFPSCGTLRLVEKVGFELAVPQAIDSVEHAQLSSIVSVPSL